MQYECIPARDLAAGLVEAWDALHRSSPQFESPFLSPWFSKAVATVRDDVFVTVIEEDGQPVGFFPFQRRGRRAGPVTGMLCDCQAVVVRPGTNWSPIGLLRSSGLSVWEFDHLLAEQTQVEPFAENRDGSPIIRLKGGFDAYAQGQKSAGSRQLEQLMRKRRKLEREHGGSDNVRFEAVSSQRRALQQVIDWKIDQCERTGTPEFFRESWAVEMVEHLLAQQTPGCAGALSVLWVGDEIAAAHFGIRSRGVWHWWFPTYSQEWSRYSPGKLLLLELCEHVAGSSTSQHTIDLGKGDDTYKTCFANDAYPLLEGCVSRDPAYTAFRSVKRKTVDWARTSPVLLPVRQLRRALKKSPPSLGSQDHRR